MVYKFTENLEICVSTTIGEYKNTYILNENPNKSLQKTREVYFGKVDSSYNTLMAKPNRNIKVVGLGVAETNPYRKAIVEQGLFLQFKDSEQIFHVKFRTHITSEVINSLLKNPNDNSFSFVLDDNIPKLILESENENFLSSIESKKVAKRITKSKLKVGNLYLSDVGEMAIYLGEFSLQKPNKTVYLNWLKVSKEKGMELLNSPTTIEEIRKLILAEITSYNEYTTVPDLNKIITKSRHYKGFFEYYTEEELNLSQNEIAIFNDVKDNYPCITHTALYKYSSEIENNSKKFKPITDKGSILLDGQVGLNLSFNIAEDIMKGYSNACINGVIINKFFEKIQKNNINNLEVSKSVRINNDSFCYSLFKNYNSDDYLDNLTQIIKHDSKLFESEFLLKNNLRYLDISPDNTIKTIPLPYTDVIDLTSDTEFHKRLKEILIYDLDYKLKEIKYKFKNIL